MSPDLLLLKRHIINPKPTSVVSSAFFDSANSMYYEPLNDAGTSIFVLTLT